MKTVLSTKRLSPTQKALLCDSGMTVVEYDALQIQFLEVHIPLDDHNYILTSQNAVHVLLQQTQAAHRSKYRAFCVGEKTKTLLEENGISVLKMTNSAADLAHWIVKSRSNEAFLFVCGHQKREELPQILAKHKIPCKEVVVYTTHLVPKKFDQPFTGILFFSPSAVQSYTLKNTIGDCWAFCIGDTTAHEAKKYTDRIVIPHKPTIENVLDKAIATLAML